MSEKSSEMQTKRDEIFTSKYCEPKYSANGAYQMFSEGFDKCFELMSKRETKLQAQLDEAIDLLDDYDKQVSILYISNWSNEGAMQKLIYDLKEKRQALAKTKELENEHW